MADPKEGNRQPAGLSSGKGCLLQAFLTLVLAVLVLGGPEFALRQRQSRKLGPGFLQPQALRDRFTAWRNNPGYARVDTHINSQGFRHSQDLAVEKPAKTVRIFFLGGSAAFGAPGGYPEIDSRWLRIYDNQLVDYYLEQKLNQAFPSKHWEVINAAASGYRVHQQLALLESVVLRYQPDYIISMDGYNDLIALFNGARLGTGTDIANIYGNTQYADEFDALANPGSFHSIAFFASTWLRANSAFYHVLQDHMRTRFERSWEQRHVQTHAGLRIPAQFSDLTPAEQAAFARARDNVGYYTHMARQIHRILSLDGVPVLFLLQPELVLSRKPVTEAEKQLRDYDAKVGGPLYIYTFDQLYRVIAKDMTAAAEKDGFGFLNLQDVFDRTSEQTFSDFAHLTPEGNRIIAERLFQFLRDWCGTKAHTAGLISHGQKRKFIA